MDEYLDMLSAEERRKVEKELQELALYNDFLSFPLVQSMKRQWEEDPNHNARRYLNGFFKMHRLPQGSDGLGCVIASVRMLLEAQGQQVPDQAPARQLIESKGLVRGGPGGWTLMDYFVAESLGVRNASNLVNVDWNEIDRSQTDQLKESSWATKLAKLIEARYLAVASMPIENIYGEGSGSGGHAFVVKGLTYNGELLVDVNDPLEKVSQIPIKDFIKGISRDLYTEEHIIVAPSKVDQPKVRIKRNDREQNG